MFSKYLNMQVGGFNRCEQEKKAKEICVFDIARSVKKLSLSKWLPL